MCKVADMQACCDFSLETPGGQRFDGLMAGICRRVSEGEPLAVAFDNEGISRSHGFCMVRDFEKSFGQDLFTRKRGCGSFITPAGRDLLHRYTEMQRKIASCLT